MGAANCCKKPTEIVIEEIKNTDEDNPNVLDQDSYPLDTELVHSQEYSQQEVSNQKLYDQEVNAQIGGAYEVPINETNPVQYNQIEGYENNNIQIVEYSNQNQQMQNEELNINNINQYSPEELAQFNLNNQIEINPQQNLEQIGKSVEQPTENINYEIQQSNISNNQPVDITTLISQRSAAPVQQVIKSQQISSENELNNQGLNIPQTTSQIKVEENNVNEDLNKYFQIPSHSANVLVKSKTSVPENINMDEIQKLIQQQQNQPQNINVNIKSDLPTIENENLNNYFKSMTMANQKHSNALEIKANEEDINKYFKNINQNDIINMKDLPETFGSNNINNYKPTTKQEIITTTKEEKGEIINPADLQKIEININESLPETFGSANIQQLGLTQIPTTSATQTTEKQDLKDVPKALTTTEINKIIEMKDLPETFGSSNINNLNQKAVTTNTKMTGDIDLNNLPKNLSDSQIQKIIDMKDLPETFGSNNINNMNQKKVSTTETNIQTNVDTKNLPIDFSINDINNIVQTTTTPIAKTTENLNLNNLQGNMTTSQANEIINMKDLPETLGSNNMKQTTTTTVTKTTENVPIELKRFVSTQNSTSISTSQNQQIKTITETVQKTKTTPIEDYSKYFEQIGPTPTQIGASNILQGSTITFKQPSINVNSSTGINNYSFNNQVIPTTSVNPVVTSGNKSLNLTQKILTTSTNSNPTGISRSAMNTPAINLNNYGSNNSQQKTITNAETTKIAGIPTENTYAQTYTLPSNYGVNKVNNSQVTKPYVGQKQTLGYNYTMPTTTSVNK